MHRRVKTLPAWCAVIIMMALSMTAAAQNRSPPPVSTSPLAIDAVRSRGLGLQRLRVSVPLPPPPTRGAPALANLGQQPLKIASWVFAPLFPKARASAAPEAEPAAPAGESFFKMMTGVLRGANKVARDVTAAADWNQIKKAAGLTGEVLSESAPEGSDQLRAGGRAVAGR